MPKKSADKILSGSQLFIATAEKWFGWKNVHKISKSFPFVKVVQQTHS
jgi:hypothetical protein